MASSRPEGLREEEAMPTVWAGPPEGELGVAVPESIVVARSARGVIALRSIIAFSNGLVLDLIAE